MNKIFQLILLTIILIVAAACSHTSTNKGTIREHHDVTRMFRSYTIIPNYNYYYYGVFLDPDTIMGIDNRYTVQSQLWKPIDLSPDQLKRWVIDLDRKRGDLEFAYRYMGMYRGAYVLDPAGQKIGIWYSKLDWGVFDFPGNNIVIPYAPSLRPHIRDMLSTSDDH